MYIQKIRRNESRFAYGTPTRHTTMYADTKLRLYERVWICVWQHGGEHEGGLNAQSCAQLVILSGFFALLF